MCRFAARVGPPASPAPLLFGGTHTLASQAWAPRELLHGSVNADGWGVAWWTADRMVRFARAEPVWYDPEVRDLLEVQSGTTMLAVLRNATPGLPVGRAGLLPFVHEGWAFALNGFIPRFRERHLRAFRERMSDAGWQRVVGVSDAETLFHLLVDRMEAGADALSAMRDLRDAVAARLEPGEEAPLTMALADAEAVSILHSSAHGPVNSLWLSPTGGPVPGGPAVASEALTPEGWERVPDHSTVRLTRDGVVVEVIGPASGG